MQYRAPFQPALLNRISLVKIIKFKFNVSTYTHSRSTVSLCLCTLLFRFGSYRFGYVLCETNWR